MLCFLRRIRTSKCPVEPSELLFRARFVSDAIGTQISHSPPRLAASPRGSAQALRSRSGVRAECPASSLSSSQCHHHSFDFCVSDRSVSLPDISDTYPYPSPACQTLFMGIVANHVALAISLTRETPVCADWFARRSMRHSAPTPAVSPRHACCSSDERFCAMRPPPPCSQC